MRKILLFSLLGIAPIAHSQFVGPKNCLQTPGTTAKYVTVPSVASLDFTNSMTVEAWINPSSFGTDLYSNTILSKTDNSNSTKKGYVLRCGAGGKISFLIGTGTAWQDLITTTPVLSLNQWQHVACTYDGVNKKIYLNGVEVATEAFSTP